MLLRRRHMLYIPSGFFLHGRGGGAAPSVCSAALSGSRAANPVLPKPHERSNANVSPCEELQLNARVSGPDPRFAGLLLEQFGGQAAGSEQARRTVRRCSAE